MLISFHLLIFYQILIQQFLKWNGLIKEYHSITTNETTNQTSCSPISICLFSFMNKVKMPGKKDKKHVKSWTKEEVEKFDQVLVNPANGFACCVDKLALKELSNNEVYEHIIKCFNEQLAKKDFTEVNEKNNHRQRKSNSL